MFSCGALVGCSGSGTVPAGDEQEAEQGMDSMEDFPADVPDEDDGAAAPATE